MNDTLQLPSVAPLLASLAPSIRGWLGGYLLEVFGRSGSRRTTEEYGRLIIRFLADVPDLQAITPVAVQRFVHAQGTTASRPPSPSTIRVRLAAVRGFLGYLVRMGTLSVNPADPVRAPGNRQGAVRGLSGPEIRALLDAMPATPWGMRDRAITIVMVLTGLRRTEVLGMRAGELSRNGRVYYSVRVKGGHDRRRELPAPAFDAIQRAQAAAGRRLDDMAADEPLFPISAHGYYANLRRYAARAGLEAVTPHVLRHSAAKLRREAGASIEDVQALLGHRSLATTATYLRRLEGEGDPGWAPVAAMLGLAS